MKTNKMMRCASTMLIAALITTSFTTTTFAKYTTQGSAQDSARVAKWGVVAFENILHYAFYVLMAAAAGALGESYGLPTWAGVLFFCVVSTTVSMLGIKGLAKVFGWLVPILTVAVIASSRLLS